MTPVSIYNVFNHNYFFLPAVFFPLSGSTGVINLVHQKIIAEMKHVNL